MHAVVCHRGSSAHDARTVRCPKSPHTQSFQTSQCTPKASKQGFPQELCFFFGTAHRPPPTVTNRQPPTANRQPLFNRAAMVLCLVHVMTMKQ